MVIYKLMLPSPFFFWILFDPPPPHTHTQIIYFFFYHMLYIFYTFVSYGMNIYVLNVSFKFPNLNFFYLYLLSTVASLIDIILLKPVCQDKPLIL